MIFNTLLTTASLVFAYFIWEELKYLKRHIDNIYKIEAERHRSHEKWLFDQLYTINKQVMKPAEIAGPVKKAEVISTATDPMREFDVGLEDFH